MIFSRVPKRRNPRHDFFWTLVQLDAENRAYSRAFDGVSRVFSTGCSIIS